MGVDRRGHRRVVVGGEPDAFLVAEGANDMPPSGEIGREEGADPGNLRGRLCRTRGTELGW